MTLTLPIAVSQRHEPASLRSADELDGSQEMPRNAGLCPLSLGHLLPLQDLPMAGTKCLTLPNARHCTIACTEGSM